MTQSDAEYRRRILFILTVAGFFAATIGIYQRKTQKIVEPPMETHRQITHMSPPKKEESKPAPLKIVEVPKKVVPKSEPPKVEIPTPPKEEPKPEPPKSKSLWSRIWGS